MSYNAGSRPDKKGNSLTAYFPEARRFRYPHFTALSNLGCKARIVWSVMFTASRFGKCYSGRKLARITFVDKNTISKLVKSELHSWVKYKGDKITAIEPPEDAVVRMKAVAGKWQDRLASIPLLIPASKKVKPLEAVILSFIIQHGNKYHRSAIARMLSVHLQTINAALQRLLALELISGDLLPVLPTQDQRSWFVCGKNPNAMTPPSYSADDYRINLLLQAGYPDRVIEAAVSLGWLEWSMAAALREVSYCEKTHEKNRHQFPNIPNGSNLFLQRLTKKRKAKKMKFAPPAQPQPAPTATDFSEYAEQDQQRRQKLEQQRRQKLEQESKAKQKPQTPGGDEFDALLDSINW